MRRDGWPTLCIHGDKNQSERDWVLNGSLYLAILLVYPPTLMFRLIAFSICIELFALCTPK